MNNLTFVAHGSAGNGDSLKVSFDDERYLRYVPFRLPWTTSVQDNLPPETAGALVNEAHLFPDLFIFVDVQEKQIYDAIDGRRTIGGSQPRARDFFQKLWRHDQVVFNTSKANAASA